MATALKAITGYEYVSPQDTDDEKTTWILRSLNGLEAQQVTMNEYVDWTVYATLGIVGWKNFKDENGDDIPFSKENIKMIHPLILQDIEIEVDKLTFLQEDERKNL